jgi:hypothetical protein
MPSWLKILNGVAEELRSILPTSMLPVAGTTTIGGVKRNAGVAGQYVTGFDTDGSTMYDEPVSGYRPGRNHLINGDFSQAQRGTTFTTLADGAYGLDRWYFLGDATLGNISQLDSSVTEGKDKIIFLDGVTAAKKFGIAQIIEAANCTDLIDQMVTLSFNARLDTAPFVVPWSDGHYKAAIVSWSGTRDVVTKDIISAWNGDDTLPTLITNATFENVPVDLTITNAWANYSVSGVIDTSAAKNVIILIWSDSTANRGSDSSTLYLDQVQLEIGTSVTPFERVPISDQLARCQRYYEVLRYTDDTFAALGFQRAAGVFNHTWYFKAAKRIKPTISSTLVTGSWSGGLTPTIHAGIDCASFARSTTFGAVGTSGNVALAAAAEL